jgi:hypothetical protein
MTNPYLSKIAAANPPASLTSKIALGVSSAGLAMAGANYLNNRQSNNLEHQRVRLEKERVRLESERQKMDERSLRALGSIHKALTTNAKTN